MKIRKVSYRVKDGCVWVGGFKSLEELLDRYATQGREVTNVIRVVEEELDEEELNKAKEILNQKQE